MPGAAAAAYSPPNTVSQWYEIGQNSVVSLGAFQSKGHVCKAYVSAAVYDAATSIQGGYEPYGHRIPARRGASTDAAVIEAAYRTLLTFPTEDDFAEKLAPDGRGDATPTAARAVTEEAPPMLFS